MYEDYYGFKEKPFSLTPDPKFLFKSEPHGSALELLQYAIRRREGFVTVTGDIGTGKTTLCRALLEQIDRNTFTALVLNPFLSEDDLLKLILQDFGVVSREDVKRGRLANVSKQELIESIYDFLLSLLPLHASAVLIIDEAQNLPMTVLEQIRILSNLETDKEKLLQVILVGQLNLNPLLKAPQMRQLDQRVSIRYQLRPLTRDEVAAYVSHRLTVAGGSASVSFQGKALDMVHARTQGIPRLINLVCDRALLAAYSSRTNRISADMVYQAAENLELVDERPSRFSWLRRRASVFMLAAGASASLGVVSGTLAPTVSAASPSADVRTAANDKVSVLSASASAASQKRYSVLVASFPAGEVTRADTMASAPLDRMIEQLQQRGYDVRVADVNLGESRQWRRVLVGEFAKQDDARVFADRVREMPAFADAQVVGY